MREQAASNVFFLLISEEFLTREQVAEFSPRHLDDVPVLAAGLHAQRAPDFPATARRPRATRKSLPASCGSATLRSSLRTQTIE
jgi:hypothetical protein